MIFIAGGAGPARGDVIGDAAMGNNSAANAEFFSGIECLRKAGTVLGRPMDMVGLLETNGFESQTDNASSKFARMAMARKLNAVVLAHVTAEQVARCAYPVMLHVKAGVIRPSPTTMFCAREIRAE